MSTPFNDINIFFNVVLRTYQRYSAFTFFESLILAQDERWRRG